MPKYVPTAITYAQSGLVKDKAGFVLSDDAYQILENIYQWRGRLRRRQGYSNLGRLRREYAAFSYFNSSASPWSFNVLTSSGYIDSIGIVGATLTITAKSNHGLSNGDTVVFSNVGGTTQLNGNTYTVSNVSTYTFDISQGGASPFTYGGIWISNRSLSVLEPNASIEKGSFTMIIDPSGAPEVITDDSNGVLSGTIAATGTINYTTGDVTISNATGSVATTLQMSYYPSLPVMGLYQRELDVINAEQTIAFDTRYTYKFNNTSNKFDELSDPTMWKGDNTNFFDTANYWYTSDRNQYFWATNYSGTSKDSIKIYDGVRWMNLTPQVDSTNYLYSCRLLIPYKGRMVALSTYEGTTSAGSQPFAQRARFSQRGAPFSSVVAGNVPTSTTQWLSNVKGRGGYVDATTNEKIISAELIKDVLVVGFERSTWILRYTGNEIQPFVWERVNQDLGCESTFSMVPFDSEVLYVGDKSINACNINSVQRIDQNIPDEVFNIHNNNSDGALRVHGKRDFYERVVYWTFPNADTQATYPDQVLVFNYENSTWALFNDSFTTFGEYQRFNDITWADLVDTDWQSANFSWIVAKLQSQFPNIIAGNQQGFVHVLNQKVSNDSSLAIKAITGGANQVSLQILDHNLTSSVVNDDLPTEYIKISGIVGAGASELNNRIFSVEVTDSNNILLWTKPRYSITAITNASQAVVSVTNHNFVAGQHFYIDQVTGMTEINGLNGLVVSVSGNDITVDIDSSGFTAYSASGEIQNLDADSEGQIVASGTYLGGGVCERVMGFSAKSKKFNFLNEDKSSYLGYIDFLANVTESGEIAVDIFTDYDESNPINDVDDSYINKQFETQADPYSSQQKAKEWHRFYCPTDAQYFSYNLKLNDRQLFTPKIADSEVLIEAIIISSQVGGRLVN